jgi:DNA-binding response OmpR family regulator
VLLINCIRDEQEMYAEHLRYSGIDPIVVCETPEAFQIAVSAQPVVIVTDISIGNGVELIRQLREDARTRTSVIIVVSARVFPADRSAAEEAGCDVFLPKPCLPETLVAEIRRALPERRP